MKIRLDFVTNSSSSSFVVVYKIDINKNIEEKIKEEFGNYGINLWDDDVYTGEQLLPMIYEDILPDEIRTTEDIIDYINNNDIDIEEVEIGDVFIYGSSLEKLIDAIKRNPKDSFLVGSRIDYSDEGETDSKNMFIIDEICPNCMIQYEQLK